MTSQSPKPKRKAPQFAKRKAAFDAVMAAYRDCQGTTLGAVKYSDGSGGSRNPAKPTMTDFKCDVDRVLKKCVKQPVRFRLAYVEFDSDDPIEREVYAEKVMGPTRHNLEQGIGAEFIRRHISPTRGKKGYFTSVRKNDRRPNAEV